MLWKHVPDYLPEKYVEDKVPAEEPLCDNNFYETQDLPDALGPLEPH